MMSFQFAGQSTFTALGRSKQAVFFSLFRKVVIVIPLIYILPHIGNLGVNGVFMAEPVSNFIGGIACFATMYFTVYRKLSTNIVKNDQALLNKYLRCIFKHMAYNYIK